MDKNLSHFIPCAGRVAALLAENPAVPLVNDASGLFFCSAYPSLRRRKIPVLLSKTTRLT